MNLTSVGGEKPPKCFHTAGVPKVHATGFQPGKVNGGLQMTASSSFLLTALNDKHFKFLYKASFIGQFTVKKNCSSTLLPSKFNNSSCWRMWQLMGSRMAIVNRLPRVRLYAHAEHIPVKGVQISGPPGVKSSWKRIPMARHPGIHVHTTLHPSSWTECTAAETPSSLHPVSSCLLEGRMALVEEIDWTLKSFCCALWSSHQLVSSEAHLWWHQIGCELLWLKLYSTVIFIDGFR